MQYNLNEPYFHKGGAIGMNAIDRWESKEYLKSRFQNVEVDIERYESDRDMEISKCEKVTVKFNDYLDNCHPGEYLPDCHLSELDIHQDIYSDLRNPAVGPGEAREHLLFIGRNTKSGAHIHIEDDFVLHQIVGKKIVYLMDFEELTMNGVWSQYANFSKENLFQISGDKLDKIYKVEMEPGDVLYIPPWTWHAVENIGYTVAVTKVYERDDSYLSQKRFKKLWWRHYSGKIINGFHSAFNRD